MEMQITAVMDCCAKSNQDPKANAVEFGKERADFTQRYFTWYQPIRICLFGLKTYP